MEENDGLAKGLIWSFCVIILATMMMTMKACSDYEKEQFDECIEIMKYEERRIKGR